LKKRRNKVVKTERRITKMMRLSLQLALSGLLALSFATAAFAEAAIFSQYSYAQAKQKAEQDHKLLLIDFTASWCPPCNLPHGLTRRCKPGSKKTPLPFKLM
jgi:thiol:disulfide interchange protein